MIPRPEGTLEYLLRQGEIEAALILDPSWGKLTQRELELVEKAWTLGLRTGKQIEALRQAKALEQVTTPDPDPGPDFTVDDDFGV